MHLSHNSYSMFMQRNVRNVLVKCATSNGSSLQCLHQTIVFSTRPEKLESWQPKKSKTQATITLRVLYVGDNVWDEANNLNCCCCNLCFGRRPCVMNPVFLRPLHQTLQSSLGEHYKVQTMDPKFIACEKHADGWISGQSVDAILRLLKISKSSHRVLHYYICFLSQLIFFELCQWSYTVVFSSFTVEQTGPSKFQMQILQTFVSQAIL